MKGNNSDYGAVLAAGSSSAVTFTFLISSGM
jgi:hypothetical protein